MSAPGSNWEHPTPGGEGGVTVNGDYGTIAPDATGGAGITPAGDGGDVQQKPSMMDKKPVRRIGAKPPPDRAPRSIYCFSVKNPFRKKCIQFVEWKPFEFLILFTILGNCVALAVYPPFPSEDTNEMNLILVSEIIIKKEFKNVLNFATQKLIYLRVMTIFYYLSCFSYRNKSNTYFW